MRNIPVGAEGADPYLVSATKLDRGIEPGWWLSVYPEAGEAGGSFRGTAGDSKAGRQLAPDAESSSGTNEDPSHGLGGALRPRVRGPERARAEADRRARGEIRRFTTAHSLNRLGTLTYRGQGCHDPRQFRQDVGAFFKRLRPLLGGDPFPYLWVPEWHPKGHGLHGHFAVGRYVRRSLIDTAWGLGRVHIKLLGDLPVGSGRFAEARQAAGYLAKYIGKDVEGANGLHRYDRAQGFPLRKLRCWGRTFEDAVANASTVMGGAPTYIWQSWDTEDWGGPPALWLSWAN
jgi:hypothetical protein